MDSVAGLESEVGLLLVPWSAMVTLWAKRLQCVCMCRQAFSVAGPTVWNSLPDFIRDPTISADCFRRLLKTYLFARY